MNQEQTQEIVKNPQLHTKKLTQAVNFFTRKMINAVSVMKQKITLWASTPSSRNSSLPEATTLQEMKDQHWHLTMYYNTRR
jgi:hypothetical protein